MADSSQKFIARNRAPRVQIEYDVELYGAEKKVQLPFVMGVMSDLSGKSTAEPPAVSDRKFLEIDVDNFDDRMKAMAPRVEFAVPNTLTGEGNLAVDLTFEKMADFDPAQIAAKIEPLRKLLEARTQLSTLMAYMDGKTGAEALIEKILADPALLGALASSPVAGQDHEATLDALRELAPEDAPADNSVEDALASLPEAEAADDTDSSADVLSDLAAAAPEDAPEDTSVADALSSLPETDVTEAEADDTGDILSNLAETAPEDGPEDTSVQDALSSLPETVAAEDEADDTGDVLSNLADTAPVDAPEDTSVADALSSLPEADMAAAETDDTGDILSDLADVAPEDAPDDTALDDALSSIPEVEVEEVADGSADVLSDLADMAPGDLVAGTATEDALASLPEVEATDDEDSSLDDALSSLPEADDTEAEDQSDDILSDLADLELEEEAEDNSVDDALSSIPEVPESVGEDHSDLLSELAETAPEDDASDADDLDDLLGDLAEMAPDEVEAEDTTDDILSSMPELDEAVEEDASEDVLSDLADAAHEDDAGDTDDLDDLLGDLAEMAPDEAEAEDAADDILAAMPELDGTDADDTSDDVLNDLADAAPEDDAGDADDLDDLLGDLAEMTPEDDETEDAAEDILSSVPELDDADEDTDLEDLLGDLAEEEPASEATDGDDLDDLLGDLEVEGETDLDDILSDVDSDDVDDGSDDSETEDLDLDDLLADDDAEEGDADADDSDIDLDDLLGDLDTEDEAAGSDADDLDLDDLLTDDEAEEGDADTDESDIDLDDLLADSDDAEELDLDDLLSDDDEDAAAAVEDAPATEGAEPAGEPQLAFGRMSADRPDPERLKRTRFRIAIFGDFSGRSARGQIETGDALAARKPILLDPDTVEDVIKSFATTLVLPIGKDGAGIEVKLTELDDLHPDELYEKVELFDGLSGLKSQLSAGGTADHAAKQLMFWGEEFGRAVVPPRKSSSGNTVRADLKLSDFQKLIGDTGGELAQASPVDDLLKRVVGPHIRKLPSADVTAMQGAVDEALSAAMRMVLHHPEFQSVEAQWRSLDLIARSVEDDDTLDVILYDVSAEEIAADLAAEEDLAKTGLVRLLTEEPLDEENGRGGYSALIGLYTFEETPPHAELLGRIGRVAAHVDAPFISAITPGYLDIKKEDRHPLVVKAWDTFRAMPEAGHVGLASPRFMLRRPYGAKSEPIYEFDFEEFTQTEGLRGMLWANPAVLVTILLARSFKQNGKAMKLGSVMSLGGVPYHFVNDRYGDQVALPCTERNITMEKHEHSVQRGYMPVLSIKGRDEIRLGSFNSVAGQEILGPWTGVPVPEPSPDVPPAPEADDLPEDDDLETGLDLDDDDDVDLDALTLDDDDDDDDDELNALLNDLSGGGSDTDDGGEDEDDLDDFLSSFDDDIGDIEDLDDEEEMDPELAALLADL